MPQPELLVNPTSKKYQLKLSTMKPEQKKIKLFVKNPTLVKFFIYFSFLGFSSNQIKERKTMS